MFEARYSDPGRTAGTLMASLSIPSFPAGFFALLRGLPREDGNPHLFVGPSKGKGLSNAAMAFVMRRMGPSETIYGFRANFETGAPMR